jgi:hypothetical protein
MPRLLGLWSLGKVLYPPEFCTEVDFSSYIWFAYLLHDTAYMHTFLAVAASFPKAFGNTPRVSRLSVEHVSAAYALINTRLSGGDACGNGAIAVVTILTIYHLLHHQLDVGIVHFHGLKRMVELRGGLAQLMKENRCLAQKPWRLALEFSLQGGSRPIYGLQDVPAGLELMPFDDLRALQFSSNGTASYPELSSPLLDLLLDITQITRKLNDTCATNKLEPMDYSDAVCVRLHRLLHFAPLAQQRLVDPLDDLVHLCLVAIMTTLMPEYGHNQAKYTLLSKLLNHALQQYAVVPGRNKELLIWAIFVSHATVLGDSDTQWMTLLVLETFERLGLRGWTELRLLLCQHAWICVCYDKSGEKLWDCIVRAQGSDPSSLYGFVSS